MVERLTAALKEPAFCSTCPRNYKINRLARIIEFFERHVDNPRRAPRIAGVE